jgi:hypothetical protein
LTVIANEPARIALGLTRIEAEVAGAAAHVADQHALAIVPEPLQVERGISRNALVEDETHG